MEKTLVERIKDIDEASAAMEADKVGIWCEPVPEGLLLNLRAWENGWVYGWESAIAKHKTSVAAAAESRGSTAMTWKPEAEQVASERLLVKLELVLWLVAIAAFLMGFLCGLAW